MSLQFFGGSRYTLHRVPLTAAVLQVFSETRNELCECRGNKPLLRLVRDGLDMLLIPEVLMVNQSYQFVCTNEPVSKAIGLDPTRLVCFAKGMYRGYDVGELVGHRISYVGETYYTMRTLCDGDTEVITEIPAEAAEYYFPDEVREVCNVFPWCCFGIVYIYTYAIVLRGNACLPGGLSREGQESRDVHVRAGQEGSKEGPCASPCRLRAGALPQGLCQGGV